MVYHAGKIACAETVINVHNAHAAGTGVEHAQKSCHAAEGTWFSPLQGVLLCDNCRGTLAAVPLSPTVLAALRHIVYAPFERCFAFSLPEEDAAALGDVVERFLLAQLGRGFNTLDFYHSIT